MLFRHSASAGVDGAYPTHAHDHVATAHADANGHEARRRPLCDHVDDGDRRGCGYGYGRAPYLYARGSGGIGIFNALFAQIAKYQRGSRRLISPISGRKMRRSVC